MEYVDGETLAERLVGGPVAIEKVLRFGEQIAAALTAAHREGVVHLDLKPSNIMLARDGVKLLDFGLAELREIDPAPSGQDTTMNLALSGDGAIIGTLPYMAPEQLEDQPVDARTDLFALGAVLYEMTTGQAPFQGSSKASVIVAILSEEPVPVSRRQPLTPPLLERAMQRCLAKEPEARWQTAADLRAELTYVNDTLHGDAWTTARGRRTGSSRRIAMVTAGLAALAVIVAAAIPLLREPQLSQPSFHHVTFRRGIITSARFAPDGQNIVYSAAWEGQPYDLYLTRLGARNRVRSASPIRASLAFRHRMSSHSCRGNNPCSVPSVIWRVCHSPAERPANCSSRSPPPTGRLMAPRSRYTASSGELQAGCGSNSLSARSSTRRHGTSRRFGCHRAATVSRFSRVET